MKKYAYMVALMAVVMVTSKGVAQSTSDLKNLEKIQIEWLLQAALASDSSPAVIKSETENLQGQLLKIYQNNDGIIKSKINYSNDKSEKSFLAQDASTQNIRASVGYSKMLTTGTQVSADLYALQQEDFSPLTPAHPEKFYDTGASAAIRQSLLKNAFGETFNKQIKQVDLQTMSIFAKSKNDLEIYLTSLIDQYHNGWILIENHKVAVQRSQRELRRFKVYQQQKRRGFIEDSEFYQIQSSYLASKTAVDEAYSKIKGILITLSDVVGMDLVTAYENRPDILEISPINLNVIDQICKEAEPKETSYQQELLKYNNKLYQNDLDIIEDNEKADLYFEARYDTNGIDEGLAPSLGETTTQKNPKISLGLGFEMPLGGGTKNRAERYDLKKKQYTNDLSIRRVQDNDKRSWQLNCHNLRYTYTLKDSLNERINLEEKRVKLLDQDLEIGRVDINTLVLAENSLNGLYMSHNQYRKDLVSYYWKLKKLNGALKPLVETYINKD